jgi:15-cis-phytoene synthase
MSKVRKKQSLTSLNIKYIDSISDRIHFEISIIEKFERNYYEALEQGISLNPVLNAFQITAKKIQH